MKSRVEMIVCRLWKTAVRKSVQIAFKVWKISSIRSELRWTKISKILTRRETLASLLRDKSWMICETMPIRLLEQSQQRKLREVRCRVSLLKNFKLNSVGNALRLKGLEEMLRLSFRRTAPMPRKKWTTGSINKTRSLAIFPTLFLRSKRHSRPSERKTLLPVGPCEIICVHCKVLLIALI
jgi:hypothetical protein